MIIKRKMLWQLNYKAALQEKLKGAQCSEFVKSKCPAYDFYKKGKIFQSPENKS